LAESALATAAKRIAQQLQRSNFRIFRGPPAKGHGAVQRPPPGRREGE
jgi:hypothetical protein